MKVFISWSGERSKKVAEALRGWLPNVIQTLEPWMSAEDINRGARWISEISTQLAETNFGILCITSENTAAPWILFEAGALSKSMQQARVCPYLYDIEPINVTGPLSQFNMAKATEEDTRKLLWSINQALEEKALAAERLDSAFEIWWPKLAAALGKIPPLSGARKPERPEKEILAEILALVRALAREGRSDFNKGESRWNPFDFVERIERHVNETAEDSDPYLADRCVTPTEESDIDK
jgi:hypothetical protein